MRLLPQGSQLRRKMQEIFREQKRDVLREFKALAYADMKAPERIMPGSAGAIFDAVAWAEKMQVAVEPIWGVYIHNGIAETSARLAARTGGAVATLDSGSAAVIEATATQSMKFCKATNATTSLQLNRALDKVRQEIAQGLLGADNTLPALTKRVAGVFDQAEAYRAERIARTEASRALHYGQRMEAVESGVVRGFRWLGSADMCPICQEIAASMPEIPLDGKFATLGSGEYADVYAPPAHPNCMCTITEILIDEEMGAPDALEPKTVEGVPVKANGKKLNDADTDRIWDYTNTDYRYINNALLGKPLGKGAEMTSAEYLQQGRALKASLKKLPGTSAKTYRGLSFASEAEQADALAQFTAGDTWAARSFQSTSRLAEYAERFGKVDKGQTIFLELKGKSGRSIRKWSALQTEEEVLFMPGSVFRVVSVEKNVVRLLEL